MNRQPPWPHAMGHRILISIVVSEIWDLLDDPRTVKLFIQLMYNKNDHLAKWSIFVRYLMSSFAYTIPFPPRPKTPFTYVIYLYSDILLSKGHLGSRGGKHLKTN